MADTFKKYEAMMAQKRQRKAEKSKSDKGKERLLPPKLTIQRLSAHVKGRTYGEIFSHNSAFLGKMLNDTDGSSEIVTIEKFIEGSPFVKYMNNTGDIDRELPTTAVEKAEALAISLTMSANKNFCQSIHKELATDYVTPK